MEWMSHSLTCQCLGNTSTLEVASTQEVTNTKDPGPGDDEGMTPGNVTQKGHLIPKLTKEAGHFC